MDVVSILIEITNLAAVSDLVRPSRKTGASEGTGRSVLNWSINDSIRWGLALW